MKPITAFKVAASKSYRDPALERVIALDLRASYHYAEKVLRGDFYYNGVKIISSGVEGRIEYVIKTAGEKLEKMLKADHSPNKPKTAEELVRLFAEKFDPTKNKSYLTALANKYLKKMFLVEDAKKIFDGLVIFDKFKSKMEVKDFNAYKDMNAFWTAVEPFEEQETGKEIVRDLKNSEATVYFHSTNLTVIIPKTEAASCTYGSGTKWCTAKDSDNMFSQYNSKGPLYILMFKSLGGEPRKFQLHYETDSFMDEKDSRVSKGDIAAMSKDAGYTEFLSKLIDQHYGDHLREVKEEVSRTSSKKSLSSFVIDIH